MNHGQRLDRLESIVRLFVKAGLRARREMRAQDQKINILINSQIRNDEKFAVHEEKFGNHDYEINLLISRQIDNDKKFAGQDDRLASLLNIHRQNENRFAQLAEVQANTDRQLASLIEAIQDLDRGSLPNR